MEVVRAPTRGHSVRGAEDEVAVPAVRQLEVEVAEDERDVVERLDDPFLELVDRRVIDVVPRLAEESNRRQLGRFEERTSIRCADPGAQAGRVRLTHEGARPFGRGLEPAAREGAHPFEHVPHHGDVLRDDVHQ